MSVTGRSSGMLCEIPVGPKEHRRLIPIITDEYPDPTFGSGAVKITGAHDFNDYGVAKRARHPLLPADGHPRPDARRWCALRMKPATIAMAVAKGEKTLTEAEVDAINLVPDDLRGLDRYEARKRVIDQITAEGPGRHPVLVKSIDKETGAEHLERVPLVDQNKMMQPHGDRSKVVIEPMLTDQWFVDTAKNRRTGAGGGADGPLPEDHPRERGEDLLPLAGEYRTLVHLPPTLVGASDSGVVWAYFGQR